MNKIMGWSEELHFLFSDFEKKNIGAVGFSRFGKVMANKQIFFRRA